MATIDGRTVAVYSSSGTWRGSLVRREFRGHRHRRGSGDRTHDRQGRPRRALGAVDRTRPVAGSLGNGPEKVTEEVDISAPAGHRTRDPAVVRGMFDSVTQRSASPGHRHDRRADYVGQLKALCEDVKDSDVIEIQPEVPQWDLTTREPRASLLKARIRPARIADFENPCRTMATASGLAANCGSWRNPATPPNRTSTLTPVGSSMLEQHAIRLR